MGTDNPPGLCRPCRCRTSVQGSWGPLSAVRALGRSSGAQHTCPPAGGNIDSQQEPDVPIWHQGGPWEASLTCSDRCRKKELAGVWRHSAPGTQDPDAPQGRGREGAAAVNARPRRCRAVGKLVQYLPASRPLVLAPRMFGCNYCTGCVTVSPKVHIWGVLRSW